MAALAALAPAGPMLSPLALSVLATLVVIAVAVSDALHARQLARLPGTGAAEQSRP